ncbi:voltage-gated hydrogen channel 1-like isoform X1 [Polyodon spathula]|uniref:voltage-gated hydrogen channel 1-like isoform X1 n=1 Tax=Polyodon spathula TaxID=7913 RepID=UPI001B7DD8B9|nr:voltage-gated hydrogen channel 1-like isoform X1 [Polyodon spathula]XP_041079275.1 voltage-gated hydrogen channel 1-like isoform X1 [Polyodon spathula]XP_041079276.1 voltage-gated hydrogen channel 1-like isoform X1 [Polyodon spathula]
MARYLKHFTAVGDDHHSFNKWQEEEFDGEEEEPSPHSLTFRDSLRKLFSSHKFQVSVVCLVILDAVFVLCELLLDLAIIKQDEHKISSQVFHYLSLALLTFFMVELFGKLFAYQLEFFHHKFEVFDGIVVIVSFVLDIVYISHEDAFNGMGLLILLRLWRVARIVNGNAAPLEPCCGTHRNSCSNLGFSAPCGYKYKTTINLCHFQKLKKHLSSFGDIINILVIEMFCVFCLIFLTVPI